MHFIKDKEEKPASVSQTGQSEERAELTAIGSRTDEDAAGGGRDEHQAIAFAGGAVLAARTHTPGSGSGSSLSSSALLPFPLSLPSFGRIFVIVPFVLSWL